MDYLLNVNAGYGITWLLSWQRTEVQKPGMDLLGGGGVHPPSSGQRGAGGGGAIFHDKAKNYYRQNETVI
jgi:hypothetical protein